MLRKSPEDLLGRKFLKSLDKPVYKGWHDFIKRSEKDIFKNSGNKLKNV